MRPEIIQIIQFFSSLAITIIGLLLTQFFQKKPKLIRFTSHISEVILKNTDGTNYMPEHGQPVPVRSHSLVIGNIGKAPARNVRIMHGVLPNNYTISPPINHQKENNEISIESLAPGEFISITYLYFPPLLWSQIDLLIKCDECLSVPANMQHIHILPEWLKVILYFLLFVGAVTTVYFAIGIILCFYNSCIINH